MTDGAPVRFELARLASYSEADIIAELMRVARLVPGPTLTRAQFDEHARVDSSTVLRKLGDWRRALERAGLADRYSGRRVSEKMRTQPAKDLSDEQILDELRRVAREHGDGRTLTRHGLRTASALVSDSVVVRRFGSWREALLRAGLELSPLGRRWTDDDYYENLLAVWTHHGRQPKFREMNEPPSRMTNGAYERKFGTWRGALEAFVDRVNADIAESGEVSAPAPAEPEQLALSLRPARSQPGDSRVIPLGLRYKVFTRDRFRCSICGRSPATHLDCTLHVDHVVAVAHGGKTLEDNLRALCADCDLGKGARVEYRPGA